MRCHCRCFRKKMKISPPVLPASFSRTFINFKKMCFIYHDKCINGNNIHIEGSVRRCEMDVPRRVRFFCDQYILRKSCYTKYTISSTRKSDESHNDKENENKCLMCEVLSPKLTTTMRHKVTMETSSTYKDLAGSTKKQKTKSVFEL